MSDITKIMEAYLGMVSGPQEETLEETTAKFTDHTPDKDFNDLAKKHKVKVTHDRNKESTTIHGDEKAVLSVLKTMYGNDWKSMYTKKGDTYVDESVNFELDEAVNMGPWNRGAINKAMSKAGIKGSQAKAFIAALRVSGTVDEESEQEVSEKKLDPVDDKENDKKFKNRDDKDIDNDGDVDSSDEYLHKKRAATDDAIDSKKKGGKVDEVSADLAKAAAKADKVAINKTDDEKKDSPAPAPAAPKKGSQTPSQKYADYKRDGGKLSMDDWKTHQHQKESLDIDFTDSFESMWSAIAETANHKKGALAPEKYDGHSSKHDKDVIAKHKKSDKKIEDNEEDGHTKTFAAAKAVKKQAPARSGADNLSNGDKSVVNPVKGK